MIRYCLPIIEELPARVLEVVAQQQSDYEYFEFWLDYIHGSPQELVRELSFQLGERAIFLFRRQGLETVRLPLSQRQRIMRFIAETNSYLDLDIAAQEEELDWVRQAEVKPALLLSYHNYERTPGVEELGRIVERMIDLDGAIIKIATLCNSRADAWRLLGLCLDLAEAGERFIVLGMGEYGRITRVFGTLWGNEMIFAPREAEKKSAPGQLTRAQLEECFKILAEGA